MYIYTCIALHAISYFVVGNISMALCHSQDIQKHSSKVRTGIEPEKCKKGQNAHAKTNTSRRTTLNTYVTHMQIEPLVQHAPKKHRGRMMRRTSKRRRNIRTICSPKPLL